MFSGNASLIFIMLIVGSALFAQEAAENPKFNVFLTGLGYSRNTYYARANGDFGGLFVSSVYLKSNGKLNYAFSIDATIHEGQQRVRYVDLNSVGRVAKLHHATGGIQVSFQFGYRLLSWGNHSIGIGLGPVLRYQVSTYPDYGWTDFIPTVYFSEPRFARTFAMGAIGSISYTYYFSRDLTLQGRASLQYDSNEDALNMFGLLIGKRINKIKKEE